MKQLLRTLPVALYAALLVALLELGYVLTRPMGEAAGLGGTLGYVVVATFAMASHAAGIVLLLALVIGPLAGPGGPAALVGRLGGELRRRLWPADAGARVGGGLRLVAFFAAWLLFSALAYGALRLLLGSVRTVWMLAAAQTALLAPLAVVAWLAFRVLAAVGDRVARRWHGPFVARLITPAAVVAAIAALALALVAAIALRIGDALTNVNYVPFLEAGGLVVLTVALAAIALRGGRAGRVTGSRRGLVAHGLVFLALAGLAFGPPGQSPLAKQWYKRRDALTSWLLVGFQQATDVDGDGFSGLFGGNDCAPWDPAISPGTLEVPGDGIDNDCFDGDMPDMAFGTDVAIPLYEPRRVPVKDYDVIVIAADSFRFDHTSLSDYHRDTTPSLKRFADDAVTFTRAYATIPYTGVSFTSTFTSQYPLSLTGLTEKEAFHFVVPPRLRLLQEILRDGGYATAAVDAGIYEWAEGFWRGFDRFERVRSHRAPDVVREAKEALGALTAAPEGGSRPPFFLLVYFYDAHHPYPVPEMAEMDHWETKSTLDEFDLRMRYWDDHFAALLEHIDATTDPERTVVLFFSDHGEAFREHGHVGHGHTLHEEQIHIPIVLRVPGEAARRIEHPVSLVDLTPTVLSLVGRDAAGDNLQGISLVEYLEDPTARPDRVVFSETYRAGVFYAATAARHKVMLDWFNHVFTFYDLVEDPAEQRPTLFPKNKEQLRIQRAMSEYIRTQRLRWERRELEGVLVAQVPPDVLPVRATWKDAAGEPAIRLEGARLATVGGDRYAETYYRCLKPLDARYNLTYHLKRKRDGEYRNRDHVPGSEYLPTTEWRAGDIIRDAFPLKKHPERRIRDWYVWVGFHRAGAALKATAPDDTVLSEDAQRVRIDFAPTE